MPTLQFKGKNIIWNHHLSIPFHTLDEALKLDFQPDKANGNLIIEGDNLLALKALLPVYTGKVKCIYIDPPYNTGNEGWVYNDNSNSPLIKEWLGKEVGKDDLTRHDKWLCMISPRLKLLRELLSDDGVIFISIDDNEQHILRQIMDELFGEDNFISEFVWKRRTGANDSKEFWRTIDHEYLIAYAKSNLFSFLGIEKGFGNYTNPDNDPRGSWTKSDLTCNKTKEERPNLYYDIIDPKTRIKYKCSPIRVWAYEKPRMEKVISEGKVLFPAKGKGTPMYKRHLAEVRSNKKPLSSWIEQKNKNGETDDEVLFMQFPLNTVATKQLNELMGGQVFNNPKSVEMISQIIEQSTNENDIVLDSFAGSGTTMHAVMDLNKGDHGKRKCILVQMAEATEKDPKKNICKDITRERVKRAIEKYDYNSGFKYLKVGIPLDAESMLTGKLPTYKQFAKYVYYLCTGENLPDDDKINEERYFVGTYKKQSVYLIYRQDYEALTRLAFNLTNAEKIIKEKAGKKCIVYAPACFLEEDYLKENNLEYVGIPYNLFRRNGQ
jgi:adenine-specific DNA-methyltransferase